MQKILLLSITNIVAFFIFLFFIEALSAQIVDLYHKFYVQKQETGVLEEKNNLSTEYDEDNSNYEKDRDEYHNLEGSPYKYSSYSVYENRAFNSSTINIGKDGARNTYYRRGNEKNEDIIWIFGASPIFGPTNPDNETIPALVQKKLNEQGYKADVKNFGVVGYTTWQSYLLFQKQILLQDTKPNKIYVFQSNNDIQRAFAPSDVYCSSLFNTAVGSKNVLTRSWNLLSRKKFIFWDDIGNELKSLFPNIIEIARIFWKIPEVVKSSINREFVIEKYRRDRDEYTQIVENCLSKHYDMFENGIRSFIAAAHANNINIVIGTLPEVTTTKKPLAGNEIIERHLKNKYFFSLSDIELNEIDQLPPTRLSQVRYVDRTLYELVVEEFANRIQKNVTISGAQKLDLRTIFDSEINDKELFSTSIHFNKHGSEIIASEIVDHYREFDGNKGLIISP